MNTQNVSFQSLRLLCSRAKARLFPAAFLLCLIGSAAWAQSPPDIQRYPEDGIPFNGSLVAVENYSDYTPSTPQLPTLPPVIRLLFFVTADGTVTTGRLGQMTVIYVGMVDYSSGAGLQCARFIAANGDSIFTTATGQASETKDANVKSMLELHTVIGGTGYFAHVSGSLTVKRALKFSADGLTGHSEGTVSGSLRWLAY